MFVEAGDPANPAIVFLHGWPTSSHLWRTFVPMAAPWMRAIVPELPDPCDLEGSAASVRDLLERLGVERYAVVGHAEGAAIAQMLAVRGGVEAMVLFDAVAFDARPPSELDAEATLRAGVRGPERLAADAIAAHLMAARPRERIVRGSPPAAAELERLEIPALIVWGEDDAFLPAELAERLGDALPMSTIALLPGCGHLVTEEAPETVVPLVFQYLRSRYLHTPHAHEEGPVTVQIGRHPPEESFRW